jgi:SAM-dependent methyltransferase
MQAVACCPLCCSGTAAREAAVERGFTYRRCDACEVLFLDPMPDPAELVRRYGCSHGETFDRGADRTLSYERTLEARRRWELVGPRIRPGGLVVELGCGSGHFLAAAREAGRRVVGLEIGDEAIRLGREELGLDVRGGTLDDLPEEADAVVAFNVLSHLIDPEETLQQARRRLRGDGLLVLETGNVAELPARRFPPLGAPEHVLHYGERSVRRLLDRAGFRVERVERRNVEWQRSLLELRAQGRRPESGGGNGHGPLRPNRWRRPAARLLLAARYLLGRFGADARHFCTMFAFARPR